MADIDNKKKILYCITKANWGGAQKYVYDLATSMNPDLYEVAVLVGSTGTLASRLQASNVRVIILGSLIRDVSLLKDVKAFWSLLKIFKQEKPDIIHLNSSKMGLLGTLAGRVYLFTNKLKAANCKPRIIFTGHGWAFNEDRSLWQKKIIFWLHKLTIALSHKTIAVSEQTKAQIRGGRFLNKKIVVVRNGLEEIKFMNREIARVKILEKIKQINHSELLIDLENRLWLGTISELHKNKGLKYLIEAVHLLDVDGDDRSGLPLVIIIGDGERKEKLQERISRYNLQDYIFMVGRVEEAEKYLKAFDVFSLTSITEALPYVLLEAGQAGLPIIASNVGGIPEIIDDMQSGILVRPKEPEEIEKGIKFLIENPEKMKFFSQNIQAKIKQSYNIDTMVKNTVEIYNK
jgi:glycosyltransferase involved in cell wall biosynthesis